VTHIALIPAVAAQDRLCHLLAQMAPYLAVADQPPEIHCAVIDGSPAEGATATDLAAVFPPFMDDWTRDALPKMLPHVRYHPLGEGADWLSALGAGDLLIVHDGALLRQLSADDKAFLDGILTRGTRLCILAPEINPYASMDLARCVRPWDPVAPEDARAHALNLLGQIRAAAMGCGRGGTAQVLALGAGPSIRDDRHWRAAALPPHTPALVCNGLIREHEILERLRGPIVACVMDIQFVGASRMAGRYLTDLAAFLNARPDRWVATSEFCAPMLRLRLPPDLRPRVASFAFEPLAKPPQPFVLDVFHAPAVVDSWNVASALALPLAASVARSVVMGGLDGREHPDRTESWNGATYREADDSVRKVMGRLPSESSSDYYALHADTLDRLIRQMLDEGWTVRSLTPSFFPSVNRLYKEWTA